MVSGVLLWFSGDFNGVCYKLIKLSGSCSLHLRARAEHAAASCWVFLCEFRFIWEIQSGVLLVEFVNPLCHSFTLRAEECDLTKPLHIRHWMWRDCQLKILWYNHASMSQLFVQLLNPCPGQTKVSFVRFRCLYFFQIIFICFHWDQSLESHL